MNRTKTKNKNRALESCVILLFFLEIVDVDR